MVAVLACWCKRNCRSASVTLWSPHINAITYCVNLVSTLDWCCRHFSFPKELARIHFWTRERQLWSYILIVGQNINTNTHVFWYSDLEMPYVWVSWPALLEVVSRVKHIKPLEKQIFKDMNLAKQNCFSVYLLHGSGTSSTSTLSWRACFYQCPSFFHLCLKNIVSGKRASPRKG